MYLKFILILLCNIFSIIKCETIQSCNNHTYFSRQQCICYSNSHIHCPNSFTATISSDNVPSHMAIQCHNMEPLLPDLIPYDNVQAIVISDCTFGNHSILGNADNLTDLSIYCKPGLNYRINSDHFIGLNNLKLLHIWCPGLESISYNAFQFISKSITHLTIRGSTKLFYLHEKLFENMTQLMALRIKDNSNLFKLPTYIFNGLKQLKSLYLDHNSIRKMNIKIFQNLEQLSDLSLIGNNLLLLQPIINDTVPEIEPKLVLLGQVELAHALYHRTELITNQNETIKVKRNIENLSFFNNLNSLTELKLDFNSMPILNTLNNLKNLRRLSLRNCSINQITENSLQGLVNLESLDLSLNIIHELSVGFLQPSGLTLHNLIITENFAKNLTIPLGALKNMQSIREMNFSRSGLKDIPFGSFSDLKHLKIIDLSNNYLNELPRSMFQYSNEIEIINLSNNILSNIPNDLLENLIYLKEFDVSGNVLSRIPPNLFSDTKNLLLFNCNDNKLRTIGSLNLLGLAHAHYLDFSNNVLATIDPEAFSNMASNIRGARSMVDLRNFTRGNAPRPMSPSRPAIELKNLSLANNRLNQLPARIFSTLSSLLMLDVSNNSLTILPSLSFLRELKSLSADGNRLRELQSPMFVDGSKLESLSLSNNFINDIPPSMLLGLGTTMSHLDMSHNSISEFNSPLLSGVESLTTLDVSHNKLRSIDFSALRSIQQADLSHNALTFKEAGWVFSRAGSSSTNRGTNPGHWGRQATFANCTELHSLSLANNSVTDILLDLRRLESLRYLDLSYNSLTTLEARDLQFISSNITVDTRHNHITSIKLREDELIPASSAHHEHAVKILVDENPISCDCRLPNLLRYLFGDSKLKLGTDMHGAELIAADLACHLPPSVRGKRLLEVETWGHYLLPLLGLCHVFH